jgi:hypothetical protein
MIWILVPGLLLVALMVYVSTRIKRTAADAYEREIVDTAEFSIAKPEGFIIIESREPEVIFGAYSKEWGTGDADPFRRVSAELHRYEGRSLEDVRNALLENAELVDEQHLANGAFGLETRSSVDDVMFENEHHVSSRNGKIYELRIVALFETKADEQKNIDELLASFELK